MNILSEITLFCERIVISNKKNKLILNLSRIVQL